jgi:ATP phosphoribosyltransferase regulatory subunit
MADLLPPEAAARRALTRRVLRSFELCGYELVTPPIIERAEVIARGSSVLESRELVRFVEPESGEVVVLRPDITPQIARMAASRLAQHPPPLRLCYEGRVFRRQHGRARNQQHVAQAGVELIGAAGVRADAEIITLAIRACEEAGLSDFSVELSDIRLVRSLLEQVPAAAREQVSALVAQKDGARLRELARAGHLSDESADQLGDLIALYGTADVLDEAARRFRARARDQSLFALGLESLRALTAELESLGLRERIVFDLSETRGLSYYTGMRFSILASGPGEAIGGGGRYDSLLTGFGWDAPATGFAIDLGNLEWTLRAAGKSAHESSEVRAVVAGRDPVLAREIAERLRRADMVAATLDDADRARCLAFARTWGYDVVLLASASSCDVLRAHGGSDPLPQQRRALSDADLDTIRRLSGGATRANKR